MEYRILEVDDSGETQLWICGARTTGLYVLYDRLIHVLLQSSSLRVILAAGNHLVR